MKMNIPPFYENWDNTHCAQCVLRGILEYFEPDEIWDWEEWDKFTGKEPDKWTWHYRGVVNMALRGYDVIQIENVEVNDFIDNGVYETLVAQMGQVGADAVRKNSELVNVLADMTDYRDARNNHLFKEEIRAPVFDDVKNLLGQGYLLCSLINGRLMDGMEGYSGHFILIYKMDANYICFHDSTSAANAERKMTHEDFLAASTKPSPEQWSITAYRLKASPEAP